MIDIRSVEFYDTYMNLRTIYNQSMRKRLRIPGKDLYSSFRADKEMIKILEQKEEKDPDRIRQISGKVKRYIDGVTELGFRDWLFRKNRYSYLILIPLSLGLLITIPLFLYGLINNIVPYQLHFIVKKRKERIKESI